MFKKLFAPVVGALSLVANKKGTFVNYANQFLKPTPYCREILLSYLPYLIDRIFEYSEKEKTMGARFDLNDEVDLLGAVLCSCVYLVKNEEWYNLPSIVKAPNNTMIAMEFLKAHSIKYAIT